MATIHQNGHSPQSHSVAEPHKDEQPPTYARDLWDSHGLKVISERIKRDEKSMKSLQNYFQDIANLAFRAGVQLHKITTYNVSEFEYGTLKFAEDRYVELLETMSKNEEILGSKVRTQCQQRLHDESNRIAKINTKLLNDLSSWHKSLEREKRKLSTAKQKYDDKKKQVLSVERLLATEKERLQKLKEHNVADKIPSIENNIITFQSKLKQVKAQSREQLDLYTKAVSYYRGFRLKFDSQTSNILDNLEATEREREVLVHQCVRTHLEIQQVMVKQSLRNIETIQKHIANLEPEKDCMTFVLKNRSNKVRPPLPEPKFHPDDEDRFHSNAQRETTEDSDEVTYWSEQWRLVIGKILHREIDMTPMPSPLSTDGMNMNDENNNNNGNNNENEEKNDSNKNKKSIFVELNDNDFGRLREKCIKSLDKSSCRLAFALILNRQRNTEYGLELGKEEFFAMVELVEKFLDAVDKADQVDVKAAKLVMIMTQSLYVRKGLVLDKLTEQELKDFDEESENENKNSNDNNDNNNNNHNNNENGVNHVRNASYLPKKNKLFLVDRIKSHNLWKSVNFWKEAFVDSVQQEIRKYPMIKRWHAEQERMEGERRNQQIVFSQLAAYSHNMKEFGMEDGEIVAFVESQNLPKDQIEMLKMTLQVMNIEPSASPRYPDYTNFNENNNNNDNNDSHDYNHNDFNEEDGINGDNGPNGDNGDHGDNNDENNQSSQASSGSNVQMQGMSDGSKSPQVDLP